MDVQTLIGEVAKRHNVLVDPKDPLFVAVTLNEILLEEHVRRIQEALDRAQRSAVAASRQQVDLAGRSASQLVTDAKHSAEAVRAAGSALRAELERLLQDFTGATLAFAAEAERLNRCSQWSAAVAVAGAAVAVAAAAALWLRGA